MNYKLIAMVLGTFILLSCSKPIEQPQVPQQPTQEPVANAAAPVGNCAGMERLKDQADCYTRNAMTTNESTTCEKIDRTSWKERCYRQTARTQAQVALCDKIANQTIKEFCINDVAIIRQDGAICAGINTPLRKTACVDEAQAMKATTSRVENSELTNQPIAIKLQITGTQKQGEPGSSVIFSGEIVNVGTQTVLLNGVGFNGGVAGDEDSLDMTVLFNILPTNLTPGMKYFGPISIFPIGKDAYAGEDPGQITIQGGATLNDYDELATQNFVVTVTS